MKWSYASGNSDFFVLASPYMCNGCCGCCICCYSPHFCDCCCCNVHCFGLRGWYHHSSAIPHKYIHQRINTKHANRIYALNILANRILTHFPLDLLFCVAASQWTSVRPQSEKCTFIINWNSVFFELPALSCLISHFFSASRDSNRNNFHPVSRQSVKQMLCTQHTQTLNWISHCFSCVNCGDGFILCWFITVNDYCVQLV